MTVLWENKDIIKTMVETVQVNLGNKCNQKCSHCHIGASPYGDRNMAGETAELVLEKLIGLAPAQVEFTGGAPEMNPNLQMFIEELTKNGLKTAVRTNLTVLDLTGYASLIDLYARCGAKVTASLPSCFKDTTDRQRGDGVFDKSLMVLQRLNAVGYGAGSLELDIVYNPSDSYLPPSIESLENDYRKILKQSHGIEFNRLITIANAPIGGFKKYLAARGSYEDYMRLLVNNFNSDTLNHIMCRRLLSVNYKGHVYDCDFNLALGIRIKGYENMKFWEIDFDDFNPEISCGEHCYACTASAGSSCHGSLIKNNSTLDVKDVVKHYYGAELKSTSDLKTGACCATDSLPSHIKEALSYIAEEIKQKHYGCGSPIPLVLEGITAMDIGCGTGRDCYILSKLVGEKGFVYGIDMTKAQIEIAIKYLGEQTKRFGYKNPNVRFIHDYVENVGNHIPENSLDLAVSNCVINLVEDKEDIMRQAHRILKDGGEFYFSDIYADRRLPDELKTNPVLYGECLGGALYWKDFERIAKRSGFTDPRIISKRVVDIKDGEIKSLVGNITFYSITYRLWKIPGLEDACEDYGHIAVYKGGVEESPFKFMLDGTHVFEKDKPERVCGNTALMLSDTRFRDYFHVIGTFERHFGLLAGCGATPLIDKESSDSDGCSCC